MGCWDETCALTRVHISQGDPVVGVLMRRFQIEDRVDPFSLTANRLLAIEDGAYDDYGGVERDGETILKNPRREDGTWLVLLHREAWDLALGIARKSGWEPARLHGGPPRAPEFEAVLALAHRARRPLVPPGYGMQCGEEEYAEQAAVLRLSGRILRRKHRLALDVAEEL
jgi:hypothetical protein